MTKYLNYILLLTAILLFSLTFTLPDGNLHVYFCDVGQGDGALITYGFTQITIDAGPANGKFLACLAKHMPFYDHTIELALGTHPQADHTAGYVSVVQRYSLKQFVTTDASASAQFWQALKKKIPQMQFVHTRDVISIGPIQLLTIWPNTSPSSEVNLNSLSLVQKLSFGDFDILFTGDADQPTENGQLATRLLSRVEVLKVPHHGSKTGMQTNWLAKILPQLAIISVGAKNTYGHPTEEALKILRDKGIKILRTDQEGTIEIVSDGKKYWIK